MTPRTIFSSAPVASYPVRRSRGLVAAALLHLAVLTALMVSASRYGPRPAQPVEAAGVRFVMVPLRGGGSPPPSATPAVDRREPTPAPSRSLPLEPLTQVRLPAAQLLSPPMPALAFNAPPVLASSSVAEETDGTQETRAAEPGASVDHGTGGHARSALPPAIGVASGQSNWAGLVLGRLEQFKRYPAAARTRREEGVCYVRFTINRQGHVLASSLDRTSGSALLDREAAALVRRADPLPPPPDEIDGQTITLTVPVEFFLTRSDERR